MNISVCIATYNGEKYLLEQMNSILKQISNDDEVVVIDDCSTDDTVLILDTYNDPRIKIFRNDVNRGHVYSFGHAIGLASNEIIFMSDQDDIWLDGRVDLMKQKLIASNALLVTGNSNFIDSTGNLIDFIQDGVSNDSSNKNFNNIFDIFIGKTNYVGCAMAFRREFLKVILPIPSYVESHDLWIAIAANIYKANLHLDELTLSRRVHGKNASIVKRKLGPKLWSRVLFSRCIIQLYYRKMFKKL